MANKVIKLSENELKKIIKESVNMVLSEISADTAKNAYYKAYDNMIDNKINRSPVSDRKMKQVDNLYQHYDRKQSNKNNLDMNMPVVIVGGDKQGRYTVKDLFDKFEIKGHSEPFQNSRYKDAKQIGYPRLAGYLGPMWDGDKLRYETQEAYDMLSQ